MEGVTKVFQNVLVDLDIVFDNILQEHIETFLVIDQLFEFRKAHKHLKHNLKTLILGSMFITRLNLIRTIYIYDANTKGFCTAVNRINHIFKAKIICLRIINANQQFNTSINELLNAQILFMAY